MNLRKGFGRIYMLICGLILLGVCTVGVIHFPKANDMDGWYSYEVERLMPKGGRSESATLQDDCRVWSDFSTEIKAVCDRRETRLRDLPSEQGKYIVGWLMCLLGTAAVLYAIRRASRWILDGFSGSNDA